jgi:hypothetical protein
LLLLLLLRAPHLGGVCLCPQKTAVAVAYAKAGKGLVKLNGERRGGASSSSSGCGTRRAAGVARGFSSGCA